MSRDQIDIRRRAAAKAVLFLFALLAVAGLDTAVAEAQMRRETLVLETSTGKHSIDIEVAQTLEEKSRGLMFRTSVPEGTGMLFPYGTPQEITMWMKNTYASLDMVFIKGDGTVHRIESGTEPMSEKIIASRGAVTAVLELAAGAATRLGVKPGDKVRHKAFGTASK